MGASTSSPAGVNDPVEIKHVITSIAKEHVLRENEDGGHANMTCELDVKKTSVAVDPAACKTCAAADYPAWFTTRAIDSVEQMVKVWFGAVDDIVRTSQPGDEFDSLRDDDENTPLDSGAVERYLFVKLYELQRIEDAPFIAPCFNMDVTECKERLNYCQLLDMVNMAMSVKAIDIVLAHAEQITRSADMRVTMEDYTARLMSMPVDFLRHHSNARGLWGLLTCVDDQFHLYREMLEDGLPFTPPARCDLMSRLLQNYIHCKKDDGCFVSFFKEQWQRPLPIMTHLEPMPTAATTSVEGGGSSSSTKRAKPRQSRKKK